MPAFAKRQRRAAVHTTVGSSRCTKARAAVPTACGESKSGGMGLLGECVTGFLTRGSLAACFASRLGTYGQQTCGCNCMARRRVEYSPVGAPPDYGSAPMDPAALGRCLRQQQNGDGPCLAPTT